MKLTLYQVDAFTNKLFGGNPAAVIPLENWIADDLMQKIALENNLSETVFFAPAGEGYDLFTAGAVEAEQRAEDEQYAKSAFDGTFSQIVCIGLLEFSDQLEPRGSVAWYGRDERELLRQFWTTHRSQPWLFPATRRGVKPGGPIGPLTDSSLQKAVANYKILAQHLPVDRFPVSFNTNTNTFANNLPGQRRKRDRSHRSI